jgi:hypothetical protein
VRKVGSRRKSVFVEESAEAVAALDEGRRRVHDLQIRNRRIGWFEVERAVRPVAVVVAGEDAEHAREVAPIHYQ